MENTDLNKAIASLGNDVVKNFYSANNSAAYQGLNELVGKLTEYTNQISQVDEIDKQDMIEELNDILQILAGAIEIRDSVLICDMLEYELVPFLSRENPKLTEGSI